MSMLICRATTMSKEGVVIDVAVVIIRRRRHLHRVVPGDVTTSFGGKSSRSEGTGNTYMLAEGGSEASYMQDAATSTSMTMASFLLKAAIALHLHLAGLTLDTVEGQSRK
ncbi:hypothetical protein KC19_VG141900 [Ceratodon purpureus]|uniref:Uncharacterized protein n=1 Tax=Ceratodon purpureus TaxID=3225 RepID=A0A8T0HR38_CERPU|nr:hypothetical protein KC19_VG141900 [Ceratodon purpureus]